MKRMATSNQITAEEIEQRQSAIKDLDVYISQYKEWLHQGMIDLDFTKEHLLQKDEEFVVCPVDSNHRMPKHVLQKHVKYCGPQKKGYTKDEVDMIETGRSFCYEKHPTVVSVKLEDKTFQEIIKGIQRPYSYRSIEKDVNKEMPLTGERAQYELKREEKVAIYDYVREVARQTNPSNMISAQELLLLQDTKEQKNPAKGKSYLERLAEERDFKRRRQSYRAKNVHVTKKSHTEIIREVIGNQMEILGQMWEDESDVKDRQARSKDDKHAEQGTTSMKEDNQLESKNSREESHPERGSRYRSRSPSKRKYRHNSPDDGHRNRYRSRSPAVRSNKEEGSRHDRRRSSSKERKSHHSKKSKHSKRRSRSKSYDSKDSHEFKSKHKHKKNKHKKEKTESEEKNSEVKPS